MRGREDGAFEEVARWLLEMTDPEVLFGDYLADSTPKPLGGWDVSASGKAVEVDAIHPRAEVVWDYLDKTTVLDEHGFVIQTETRGKMRAMVDGVTGYTLYQTNNIGVVPRRLGVIRGGMPGRIHPGDGLNTYRLNLNFHEPLALHHSLPVHWVLDFRESSNATRLDGLAEVVEIPTRHLTLRAQFDDRLLPVRPHYYVAWRDRLIDPIGPKRPLKLKPGSNTVEKPWPILEMSRVYVISWKWPKD